MTETVHLTVESRRATVRLDRPEVHNALDRPTLDGIAAAFREIAHRDDIGVVVLTGTGDRAFSTGADLGEQEAFLQRPNDYWAWMGHFIAAVDAIRQCPVPVVARLNGMVVGRRQRAQPRLRPGRGRGRHLVPPRRPVARLAAGGRRDAVDAAARGRPPRARGDAAQPAAHGPSGARLGLGQSRRAARSSWTARSTSCATSCSAKMPEIVRATKVQLDFWKDLSWAAHDPHGPRVADDPRGARPRSPRACGRSRRSARSTTSACARASNTPAPCTPAPGAAPSRRSGTRRSAAAAVRRWPAGLAADEPPSDQEIHVPDDATTSPSTGEQPRIRVESPATDPATGEATAGVALVTLDRPEVLNALD